MSKFAFESNDDGLTRVRPVIWRRIIPRSLRHWLEGANHRTAVPIVIGRQVGVLRVIAFSSPLVPLVLLGVIAWQIWNLEMEELDARVTNTLSVLSEEAEKVFENQRLALDWIEDRTKHLTWAEIESSREFFHFTKFFADIGGAASDLLCLIRTDGRMLASNAGDLTRGGLPREHPCTVLMREAGAHNNTFVSTLDGATRMGGTRRLRAYPIVLGYAADVASVRREWMHNVALIGAAAIVSSLVLFALSSGALRIAQSEQRAIGAWQEEVKYRERIEAQMRQASKIESLGRMVSGIAHHFNNLLPAMSGLLELTLTEVPPDGATAKRLKRMLDAVTEGRRLMRNILLFSRAQVSSEARVVIATLIEETLALVEGSLPANVKVVTRLRYRGKVVADPSQLQEIFMNLISNAVHAIGSKDGTIELVTEHATIDADAALHFGVKPGEFVRVLCRDNGAGMPRDVIKHAFEPFFTTKPAAEGTGLGLAIVHGFVTDLGGGIQVESAPGLGSSFSLHLPLAVDVECGSGTA